MIKIKEFNPCPFCGDKVKYYKNVQNDIVGIQCTNKKCGATVSFFIKGWNIAYNNTENLLLYYNKRSEK